MKKKPLHTLLFLCCILFVSHSLWSQTGFVLPEGEEDGKVNFELVNNLVILPVEINNVELSFILDSGVSYTLLFGATQDTLQLNQTSKVMFRGLGEGDPVEALRSKRNTIKVGAAEDRDHSLFVVLDESLNFSSRMGVPVHGILGYDFFKNFIVTINYRSKVLKYTSPEKFNERKLKKFKTYPLLIENRRPYVNVVTVNEEQDMLMLIDTGSSDGVWVFQDNGIISEEKKNYFVDFLGLGLSGSIYGKRSRVDEVELGDFGFKDVNVAIPESDAIIKAKLLKDRKGSVGSQIMKRFTVVFDYTNKRISFKKNSLFKNPFYYNMSGLTLEHKGVTLVENKISNSRSLVSKSGSGAGNRNYISLTPATYEIFLAPTVVVAEVSEGSLAEKVDIRVGDVVISVNGKSAHNKKLHEISAIFSSKEGKLIRLAIERNGEIFKKKFSLKKLF